MPEYAEAIEKMKGGEEGVAALPDAEEDSEMVEVQAAAALRSEDVAAAAKVAEVGLAPAWWGGFVCCLLFVVCRLSFWFVLFTDFMASGCEATQ